MNNVISLKRCDNMRQACELLEKISMDFLKENNKKETVELMVSSYSPGNVKQNKYELVEIRCHYNKNQTSEMQWFLDRCKDL